MIRLRSHRLFSHRFALSKPFRFGIASLTWLEHLLVEASFDLDGTTVVGYAGENLAPRWFVKDPTLDIDDEVVRLRNAVRLAIDRACALGTCAHPFDLWWRLHRDIRDLSRIDPPLLAQLAESLIERAAIDALCRARGFSLAQAVRLDALGFDPSVVHSSLGLEHTIASLPASPAARLRVRHTVGLADDPNAIAEQLRGTGVSTLKVKLGGQVDTDLERLGQIVRAVPSGWMTLDGNENYADLATFARLLTALANAADLRGRIAWIEQPLRRDIAMADDVAWVLRGSSLRVVIDESDASPDDLPRALSLGYAGATVKSCKGVFKSLLHAGVLAQHALESRTPTILSGEDLTIVAPWSQASDLELAAACGVVDVERNGHHYADGLASFPPAVGDWAMRSYPALYRQRADGVVTLRLEGGELAVPASTHAVPPLEALTSA